MVGGRGSYQHTPCHFPSYSPAVDLKITSWPDLIMNFQGRAGGGGRGGRADGGRGRRRGEEAQPRSNFLPSQPPPSPSTPLRPLSPARHTHFLTSVILLSVSPTKMMLARLGALAPKRSGRSTPRSPSTPGRPTQVRKKPRSVTGAGTEADKTLAALAYERHSPAMRRAGGG